MSFLEFVTSLDFGKNIFAPILAHGMHVLFGRRSSKQRCEMSAYERTCE